ncbi:MAG TPA: SMP-30/gluconolactonase/LRE family protein [Sphingomicrobium sp.]
MASEPKVAWGLEAQLGEGPIWVERDQALWFVDIKEQLIHRFDPANGSNQRWHAPQQVSFLFPAERGGFVAGLHSGLYHFDERDGRFEQIVAVEADKPDNRLNDGAVDPHGRLWFGTMDNKEQSKSGAFYCFAAGKVTRTDVDGIAITNGPAVSPDGSVLYLVDTKERTIEAADIAEDGTLGPRRPFVTIDEGDGHPDGPTIDSEGCLWIALYGGWEVRRYSPIGDLLERVRFPVVNITKIAFGGPDLRTAYATTARQLLSAEEIAKQPEIGDLFAFDAGVAGIACPLVRY